MSDSFEWSENNWNNKLFRCSTILLLLIRDKWTQCCLDINECEIEKFKMINWSHQIYRVLIMQEPIFPWCPMEMLCMLLEAIMEESWTLWRNTLEELAGLMLKICHMSIIGRWYNKWALPYNRFNVLRHCAVADELNLLIYMVGGVNRRRDSRQYNIRSNQWQNMADNSLNYDARDCAAGIIANHHNGRRRLIVHGSWSTIGRVSKKILLELLIEGP